MPRETLTQRRASKLEKLRALQAEIDALDEKTGKRLGVLCVKAGLGDVDVTDTELLRELRSLALRLTPSSRQAAKPAAAEAPAIDIT